MADLTHNIATKLPGVVVSSRWQNINIINVNGNSNFFPSGTGTVQVRFAICNIRPCFPPKTILIDDPTGLKSDAAAHCLAPNQVRSLLCVGTMLLPWQWPILRYIYNFFYTINKELIRAIRLCCGSLLSMPCMLPYSPHTKLFTVNK